MYLKLSEVLCLQNVRQMVVAQGYKQGQGLGTTTQI